MRIPDLVLWARNPYTDEEIVPAEMSEFDKFCIVWLIMES